MKLFDSVVIGCDNSAYSFQAANAIRTTLEAFGLRVHLYDLVQKQDTLKFLTGAIPECDYVILCCHGENDVNGGAQIAFQVVDQADGDYSQADGWERVKFALTPANIPSVVQGRGRTLICLACGSGQEASAQAFFQAGYKAYIAPCGDGLYANAGILFVIGFFYRLLTAAHLGDDPTNYTDQEAVTLAATIDADYTRGTRAFHYYDAQ